MRYRFLLILLAGLASGPGAAEDRVGFGYCAPPFEPACVDQGATYRSSKTVKLCGDEVQRFMNSVVAYRACLDQETQRAILQVNEAISRYRCRSQSRNHDDPACPFFR